jgi:hypothetical protein
MKKITFILMAFLASTAFWQVQAQGEILQADGVFSACTDFQDGDIYADTGGIAANYQSNENLSMELVAPAGETLTVEFTTFNTEANWDSLTVTGDTGGFDGTYDGTAIPPTMTSAAGAGLTFDFFSDASATRSGWTANLGISNCPPPPPVEARTSCSENMPLEFSPPLFASAATVVTSTTNSGDTGVIGTGLGQWQITSIEFTVQGDTADQYEFAFQAPNGAPAWLLGAFAGGSDGLDDPTLLTFTDSSTNNYFDWDGTTTPVDFMSEEGAMNVALDGLDINGDWFLIVGGNGAAGVVTTFCVNLEMQNGTPPIITCIPDFVAFNDEGECGAVVNYTPATAVDGDTGLPLDVVLTAGGATGTSFPVGDNEVTFTATNEFGSSSSCTFIISVEDNEAPMAVCGDFTVSLDDAGEGFLVASDLDGGSTDNCAVTDLTASQVFFTCEDVGTVTVTLTVTDEAGNSSTCDATVTVVDDIAPVVTCAGAPGFTSFDESFAGGTQPAGWEQLLLEGTFEWAFGSGAMPVPGSPAFATNAAIFDDDAAGIGETNFAVLLSPAYDIPADALAMTVSFNYALQTVGAGEEFGFWVIDEAGELTPIEIYGEDTEPVASGDIDVLAYASSAFQVAFSYNDGGNGTWGWGAGVNDVVISVETPQQPPTEITLGEDGTVTIPASALIDNATDACGVVVTSGSSSVCDISVASNGFENGLFNNGAPFWVANQVVLDGSFTVTAFELNLFHDPGATIDNVLVVYYADEGGQPGEVLFSEDLAPVSQNVVGANFGFDVSTVGLVPTVGELAAGTYWVGTLATSSTGGVTAWEVSTVADGENALNTEDGIAWGAPGAGVAVYSLFGICGTEDPANFTFDCSNLGESEVTVYVTDPSGNTTSCTAVVEVFDVTAPVLVCGPGDGATTVSENFDSLPSGWSLETEIGVWEWTFGAPGAGAAGGTIPFDSNAAVFDDDAAGNGETNRASLLTPVWNMEGVDYVNMNYDYTFNELGAGETLKVDVYDGANWVNIITYDVDQLEPLNSGVIDGTPLANANFQVRWTYDDAGAWGWNAGIDDFEINFAIAPTSSDVTITLDENGEAMVDPYAFLSEGFDACGIDVIVADYEMFTCDDIGAPIVVTVFASDASGNTSSCSVEVVVVDTMGPEFTCPDDQSIMVDPDGTHTVDEYFNGMIVTDNCNADDLGLTQDPAPGTVLGVGVWDITLTATDDYGNSTTCTFELDLTLLGTDDNELNNAISIYPNPANEQVTISNSSNIALETAMIYDLNGKLVSQINLQNMQSEKMIDVSAYATGVYMVYITGEQSSVVKRLIKE